MTVRFLLCVMLVLVAAPTGVGAGDRLTLHVTPTVAFAPADLTVRALVQANADNRWIEIIAESGEFYRSSEIPLDGDQAPRTMQFELRGLPGGRYTVAAVLKGASGQPLVQTLRDVTVVATPRVR